MPAVWIACTLAAGVLFVVAAASRAEAEGHAPPAATIPLSDSYILHSVNTNQDYRISVARPVGLPADSSRKLPAIYLLDADELFGLTADTARLLADAEDIPPLLVVGIGYRIKSFDEAMEPRSTDFTPVADRPYENLVAELTGNQRHVTTGGADAFLRFIRDELKPFIAARYSVDPADSGIVGHSLGGLFGLYALLHEPGTFQRYIIGSPCLLCGDDDLFKREAGYAATHKDLGARVYMDVGAQEADLRKILNIPPAMQAAEHRYLDATGNPDSVALFRRFVENLRSRHYPGLHLNAAVEGGEGHESMPPILITRGLRAVYGAAP
jgi:hypothetical protein